MKPNEYSSGKKSLTLCWIFLLFISSCQQTNNEVTTSESESTQVLSHNEVPTTETVSPLDSGEGNVGIVPIEIEIGPGDFVLTDAHTGLDQLSNYTSNLVVSFSGTVNGETQEWTQTYKLIHTAQPPTTQLFITTMPAVIISSQNTIEADLPIPIFLADVGDVQYEMTSEGTCRAEAINPERAPAISQFSLYEPASMIKPVFGAEVAGQEIINGITATHYTFDQRALLAEGIAQASGEFWAAVDSGMLLRYLLTVTSSTDYFGEGIEGTMSWDYLLTDIDTTLLAEFPEGCQLDVPLMADATQIRHLPYWLTYTSQSSSVDTVGFYQKELSALGWALTLGPLVTDSDTFLEYTRNDQVIGIFISANSNGLEVNIVLYRSNDLTP